MNFSIVGKPRLLPLLLLHMLISLKLLPEVVFMVVQPVVAVVVVATVIILFLLTIQALSGMFVPCFLARVTP
ncbi:hypothetical protein CsSME_00005113 [Camellia sinensis var. sinensis]